MNKNIKSWTIIPFLLFCVIISILTRQYYLVTAPNINLLLTPQNLYENGIAVIPNFISNTDIVNIKQYIETNNVVGAKKYIISAPIVQEKINNIIGDEYEFNDYIFLIKKSQFHTCHRDYNGDFFNEGQTHPSYTIIIYLENMEKCLDVIPKSHIKRGDYNINITDYTQSVLCKAGDAILFNANLVHNGSLNEQENNMRIQMKISHRDDQTVLHFYNNYNKILNAENNTPMPFKQIQKHVSCQFPILSEYLKQYDYNKDKNVGGESTSFFSHFFAKLETVPP